MNIISSKVVEDPPYATLVIETDLGLMAIPQEQKLYLSLGLVFTGSEMSRKLPPVTLPEDLSLGREETVLEGFTDDPQIVLLYQAFRKGDYARATR